LGCTSDDNLNIHISAAKDSIMMKYRHGMGSSTIDVDDLYPPWMDSVIEVR